MTSRLSRAAALAAGPLLTVALLVPSASADVWVIHDATGDGSGGTSGGEGKWATSAPSASAMAPATSG
jgi:hypothetical protein